MTLEQIAKAHWSKGEVTEAFAGLIRAYLDAHHGTTSTTNLLLGLGATVGQLNALANRAGLGRKLKLLNGYWDAGGVGAFGKPKITWHAKAVAPITGNKARDAILALIDEDARPLMLEHFAREDAQAASVASAPQSQEKADDDAAAWLNQT